MNECHSLMQQSCRSCTHSLSLIHSVTITHSLIHCHSFTHPLSLIHSPSVTHSLTHCRSSVHSLTEWQPVRRERYRARQIELHLVRATGPVPPYRMQPAATYNSQHINSHRPTHIRGRPRCMPSPVCVSVHAQDHLWMPNKAHTT